MTEQVQRFRFTTDYGEVYAVAVRGDDEGPGRPTWKVGFAFCSPQDRWKPRGEKVKFGYDLATERIAKGRVAVTFADPIKGVDRRMLGEVIIGHLLRAVDNPYPEDRLGVQKYKGRKGKLGDFAVGDFMRWFRGEFSIQLRERYAGGA